MCPLCKKNYDYSDVIKVCPLKHCPNCGSTNIMRKHSDVSDTVFVMSSLGLVLGFILGAIAMDLGLILLLSILFGIMFGIITFICYSKYVCNACGAEFLLPIKDVRLVPDKTEILS
jgi:DNA-directed RNA polymerase subunit RPC12/RpoP